MQTVVAEGNESLSLRKQNFKTAILSQKSELQEQ